MAAWGRRVGAGAAAGLLHAALVAVLLAGRSGPPAPAAPPAVGVSLHDGWPGAGLVAEVTEAAVLLAPVSAEAPSDLQPAPMLTLAGFAPPVFEIASGPPPAAAAGGGAGCDLTAALERRLQADVAVQGSLTGLPREARATAGAVTLWNGAWAEGDGGPLAPIRRAILDGVAQAPPDCLEARLNGPVFLLVTGPEARTLLTLGGGAWRWSDVLASPG